MNIDSTANDFIRNVIDIFLRNFHFSKYFFVNLHDFRASVVKKSSTEAQRTQIFFPP